MDPSGESSENGMMGVSELSYVSDFTVVYEPGALMV